MEAQIYEIASNASQLLPNPLLLAVPIVGVLALVTGFAGRIALFLEDFMYARHSLEATPLRLGRRRFSGRRR